MGTASRPARAQAHGGGDKKSPPRPRIKPQLNHRIGTDVPGDAEVPPRPQTAAPLFDNVPDALRGMRAWVLWRYAPNAKGDGWTKVPTQRTSKPASTTDERTWCSFDKAREVFERGSFDGVGLVLTEDIAGIDLDHVVDEAGNVEAWAEEVLDRFGHCYVEFSPSDTGLHILCRGTVKRSGKAGPANRLEVYGAESPRFLTITGRGGGDAVEAQEALDWLHESRMQHKEDATAATAPARTTSPAMSDESVLRHARAASNAAKFVRLFDEGLGDTEDVSSLDMALASMLAFWTQDAAQVERLMRASHLARDKWDAHRTYLSMTIAKALAPGRERYETDEHRRERQRKAAQAIGSGDGDIAPVPDRLTLDEMRAKLVLIADGSRVAPRDAPHTALALPDFRVLTKASMTPVGRVVLPTADLWLSDQRRVTTHTLTFRPGHGEFTTDPEEVQALNLWRPRVRSESNADVQPFLDHVAYLVPDDGERERFLDWLGHIEQRPGVLPHTSYLMVTAQTGIGRNWLTNLMARVWPGAVRLGFDLFGALHSGFNGGLSRRLLVVVDELKAADSGYSSGSYAQALKSLLTTEHRMINPKYGRQHIEFNCARWLMLSNHYDALPLERNDRRVIVISNPLERRPQSYYTRLYGLIDDPDFANAVGNWLGARDISAFNPSEPAPLTESKAKAIDASIGEVEKALLSLRDGTDRLLMKAVEVTAYCMRPANPSCERTPQR